MLGFSPDFGYDVAEEQLGQGDVLCLYAEGITEARDSHDEEFQIERLTEVLISNRERSAGALGFWSAPGTRPLTSGLPPSPPISDALLQRRAIRDNFISPSQNRPPRTGSPHEGRPDLPSLQDRARRRA
jgi:hypothetical protein